MTALTARLGPRLARLAGSPPPADADLLGRYAGTRDEAAFAELVRRHGPAVLAVCRRVTRDPHEADDAFQAVFLVLARRAGAVRRGEPLAAWLYGVAVRVARKAAARAARRREKPAATMPDVPARPTDPFDPDEALVVLEEIARLSPKYRAAVILCELEGRPRAAAARELGIAPGTLSSRLAAARKELADRLAARGFGPAALAALAPVALPRRLAAAAALIPAGRVPPAVNTLARGVLPPMTGHRLPFVPLLAGLVAAAAFATPGGDTPPRPAPAPAPAPRLVDPFPKGPNQLFFYWGDRFYRCDPDGRNGRVVSHPACHDLHSHSCSLSPDGTKVAYVLNIDNRDNEVYKLFVLAADGWGPAIDLGDGRATLAFCWSGDGAAVVVMSDDPNVEPNGKADIRHEVIDVATGRRTRLAIPPDHYLIDWSRDGERFLTAQLDAKDDTLTDICLLVMNRNGKLYREIRRPAKMQPGGVGRLSPDGQRVLYDAYSKTDRDRSTVLLVCDLASGDSTPVAGIPPGGDVSRCCWSPDGRRIAYTWGARQVKERHVIVCDPDGRNRAVVATERSARNGSFGAIDWR